MENKAQLFQDATLHFKTPKLGCTKMGSSIRPLPTALINKNNSRKKLIYQRLFRIPEEKVAYVLFQNMDYKPTKFYPDIISR